MQITIPNVGDAYSSYWIKEVSSILDTGIDVEFYDGFGNPACVNFIQVSSDGLVKFLTLGMTVSVVSYFVKGGFLKIKGIHKIFAIGTDSTLGLNVKLDND